MIILALITARGGSKGIPHKNIVNLGGKPLIAWTIDAVKQCRSVDRVVVSTDDAEIADICRLFGAEVPFMRPEELAQDGSAHIPVIQHALRWIEKTEGVLSDYVLLLQPTSPFRSAEDIDRCCDLALETDADAVVSVREANDHPYLQRSLDLNGELQPIMTVPSGYLRRQDMPPFYVINGAMYLCRTSLVLEQSLLVPPNAKALIMPAERSLDIDTPADLEYARFLL